MPASKCRCSFCEFGKGMVFRIYYEDCLVASVGIDGSTQVYDGFKIEKSAFYQGMQTFVVLRKA